MPHAHYSPEQKAAALDLAAEVGDAAAMRRLGVHRNTLRAWRAEATTWPGPRPTNPDIAGGLDICICDTVTELLGVEPDWDALLARLERLVALRAAVLA